MVQSFQGCYIFLKKEMYITTCTIKKQSTFYSILKREERTIWHTIGTIRVHHMIPLLLSELAIVKRNAKRRHLQLETQTIKVKSSIKQT